MAGQRSNNRLAAMLVVAGCLATVGIGWASVSNHVVPLPSDGARIAASADTGRTAPTGTPRLAWHTSASELGYPGLRATVVAQTSSVLLVGLQNAAGLTSETFVATEPSTGKVLWKTTTTASCNGVVRGRLLCVDTGGLPGWAAGATDTRLAHLDVDSGRVVDGPSLASLGFSGERVTATTMSTGPNGFGLVEVSDNDDNASGHVLARLGDDLSSVDWRRHESSCDGSGGAWRSVTRDQGGVLLVSNANDHFVVDAGTGRSLATIACGSGDLYGGTGLVASRRTASTATAPLTAVTPSPYRAVDFGASAQTPANPIVFRAARDGSVQVLALGLAGGKPSWTHTVTLQGSPGAPQVFGAAGAGQLVLVDTAGHVISVDPQTGEQRWTADYRIEHTASNGANFVAPTVSFDGAGNVLVTDADPEAGVSETVAFDATSGRPRGVPKGWHRPLYDPVDPVHGVVAVVQGQSGIGALIDPER